MAVTSDRDILIQLTGDVEFSDVFSSQTSIVSPGSIAPVELASGNNTITIPDDAIAVTIIKPAANTVQLIAKGVNGDTGIRLNLLDPDCISLGTTPTLVLNAASAVTVRLIFT